MWCKCWTWCMLQIDCPCGGHHKTAAWYAPMKTFETIMCSIFEYPGPSLDRGSEPGTKQVTDCCHCPVLARNKVSCSAWWLGAMAHAKFDMDHMISWSPIELQIIPHLILDHNCNKELAGSKAWAQVYDFDNPISNSHIKQMVLKKNREGFIGILLFIP